MEGEINRGTFIIRQKYGKYYAIWTGMALNQVYNKDAKIMIVISQSQSMNTNDLKTLPELTYTNVFQNIHLKWSTCLTM